MVNEQRMAEQLILHEGLELKPYRDSRRIWTVGVGYNLEARGVNYFNTVIGRVALFKRDDGGYEGTITREEAIKVLARDIKIFEGGVRWLFREYDQLNEVRQRVVLDLAFNLGHRLEKFHDTARWVKAAIRAEDNPMRATAPAEWHAAAFCLMKSLWARQVDDGLGGKFGRADRLATMLISGVDYAR